MMDCSKYDYSMEDLGEYVRFKVRDGKEHIDVEKICSNPMACVHKCRTTENGNCVPVEGKKIQEYFVQRQTSVPEHFNKAVFF